MLTDLILNLVLPCSILASFLSGDGVPGSGQLLQIFLLSLGLQIVCFFLSFLLYRRCEASHKTALQYATICSNSGLLGTPVAAELYGESGALLASMYLLPLRIAMWTVGLSLFTGKTGNKSLLQMALHPCVIATLCGTLFLFLQVRLPLLVTDLISTIGGCNTFLSLALVGCTIADMQLSLIAHKDTIYFTFIRLLILPLLVVLVCEALRLDPFVKSVAVTLTAMPAGATTSILALKYDKSPDFAAAMTALSTVLSLFAIPAWYMMLLNS